jgi:raffinose/stachyose/melibiose transport system substrate-binding protein
MNRVLSLFLVVFLIFVTLVGCGAPGANSKGETQDKGNTVKELSKESNKETNKSDKQVTLKVGGIEYQYTQAEIKEFEKRNPDIKIEWNEGGNNFEDGSIQALLRSGSGPDVMVVSSGPGRVGLLSDAGLIKPLEATLLAYNIEVRYQDWVIDQTRTQGKGKVYELVEGVDVFQVYYNKEMFDKVGIAVPTTWQEFMDNSKKLKEADILPIVAGFRKGIGGGWMLGNIVEASAGKDVMTDVIYGDGKFDQEQIILGAEMLKELVDNNYVNGKEAASIDQNQAQAAFLSEQAAMNFSPQGMIAKARKEGTDVSKFGSFLLPSREEGRPSRPSAGLAHSWIISESTKNMAAAERWLDWVSSEDYARVAAENGGTLVPVVKLPIDIKLDPAIEDATKKLENGAGYNPSVYLPAKAKDAWYAAAEGIITGSITPEDGMKGVEKELAPTKK